MDTSLRVIDYIRNIAENIQTVDGMLTASQMLEKFLFPGDLQYTVIGRLSGGERRRLFLLRVLMDAPNVLLLDEPTNDLDIQTLVILEEYLQNFDGAVVAVSHDRYFLDKVADHILVFQEDGVIKQYLGGYTDYFEEVSMDDVKQPKNRTKNTETPQKEDTSSTEKPKKLKFTFKEQREFDTIDQLIADLERQLADLEKNIEREASDFILLQELLLKKEALKKELDDKTERWVYLNELAEQIEEARTSK